MTAFDATTARALVAMLVELLPSYATTRREWFAHARVVLAEMNRLVDAEERAERGQPYR